MNWSLDDACAGLGSLVDLSPTRATCSQHNTSARSCVAHRVGATPCVWQHRFALRLAAADEPPAFECRRSAVRCHHANVSTPAAALQNRTFTGGVARPASPFAIDGSAHGEPLKPVHIRLDSGRTGAHHRIPVVVSDVARAVYVTNVKAASTAITTWLLTHARARSACDRPKSNMSLEELSSSCCAWPNGNGVLTTRCLTAEQLRSYFVFSFVRDPIAKFEAGVRQTWVMNGRHRRYSADQLLHMVLRATSGHPWDASSFPRERQWLDEHFEPSWWRLSGEVLVPEGFSPSGSPEGFSPSGSPDGFSPSGSPSSSPSGDISTLRLPNGTANRDEGGDHGSREARGRDAARATRRSVGTFMPRLSFVGRVESFQTDWERALDLWPPLKRVAELAARAPSKIAGGRMPAHQNVLQGRTAYFTRLLRNVSRTAADDPDAALRGWRPTATGQAACGPSFDKSFHCAAFLEATRGSTLSPGAACALCRSFQFGQDVVEFGYAHRCRRNCTSVVGWPLLAATNPSPSVS